MAENIKRTLPEVEAGLGSRSREEARREAMALKEAKRRAGLLYVDVSKLDPTPREEIKNPPPLPPIPKRRRKGGK